MPSPRIAASSYLNTSPLCYSFVRGKQRDLCEFLSDASPALCAEMLARGEADAAMIPVIEYQRISGIKISPHTCVSSRSRVRSVVLVSKVPVRQIQSVALDTTSRTSAVLVRILLAKFYGLSPEYRPAAPQLPEMLKSSDAALVIGDPAMVIDRSGLEVYDLSEEWLKHTGLPFVFAFWAIRTESEGLFHGAGGSIDFVAALEEGLDSIDVIASEYSISLNLPKPDLVEYLTRNISYKLDEDALRGLSLYYSLAHECNLIDSPRELEFCSE